jgi:fructose-specific phosphotransferase system IIA component
MLLTQILKPSCVKAPLAGTDKESIIEELISLLHENKMLTDKADVLDAVLAREMTRSTGIGSGIAIPHGKCKGVNDLVMAVGITPKEIEFDSIDGKGVKIIVLLVSPLGKTGPHIQALARISRLMLDEDLREGLTKCKSAAEVYHLIKEKERE